MCNIAAVSRNIKQTVTILAKESDVIATKMGTLQFETFWNAVTAKLFSWYLTFVKKRKCQFGGVLFFL